jgi:hypothetical protein
MRTNPRVDDDVNTALHSYTHGMYRKAIRLVKYWNKSVFQGQYEGYFIELSISQYFCSLKAFNYHLLSLVEALSLAFTALVSSQNTGRLESFVVGAPPLLAPTLTSASSANLTKAGSLAAQAYSYALSGNEAESIACLEKLGLAN